MATTIRTPTGFLTALRAVVGTEDGSSVLDALTAEMARRRSVQDRAPLPWTLPAALEELAARPHTASLFGAIRLLQGAQPAKVAPGYS